MVTGLSKLAKAANGTRDIRALYAKAATPFTAPRPAHCKVAKGEPSSETSSQAPEGEASRLQESAKENICIGEESKPQKLALTQKMITYPRVKLRAAGTLKVHPVVKASPNGTEKGGVRHAQSTLSAPRVDRAPFQNVQNKRSISFLEMSVDPQGYAGKKADITPNVRQHMHIEYQPGFVDQRRSAGSPPSPRENEAWLRKAAAGLSTEQLQAAHNELERPLLILAGAGTGKTRTLANRVVYMLLKGIPQENILALSFTNKAAKELHERIVTLYNKIKPTSEQMDTLPKLIVSTFHSLSYRWLCLYYRELGFKRRPVVYEKTERTQVIKQALDELVKDKDKAFCCKQLKLASSTSWEGILQAFGQRDPAKLQELGLAVKKRLDMSAKKRTRKGAQAMPTGQSEGHEKPEWAAEIGSEVHKVLYFANRSRGRRNAMEGSPSIFAPTQQDDDTLYKERYIKEIKTPAYYLNFIDRSKSKGHVPEEFIVGSRERWVFQQYQELLQAANAVDFDDMLRMMGKLVEGSLSQKAARHFKSRFLYILVDEYQDTNSLQVSIMQKAIEAGPGGRVTVVGDDDQSIYGFRGADRRAFNIFKQAYSHQNLQLCLQENYRSTGNILRAAQEVLKDNENRVSNKVLRPLKAQGEPVLLVEAGCEADEADFIAARIAEYKRQDPLLAYKDIAVLFRCFKFQASGNVTILLQEALQKHNIPYKVAGGTSLFDGWEVTDVLAYLRLLLNPDDDAAFSRIANKPPRGLECSSSNVSKVMQLVKALQAQQAADGRTSSLSSCACALLETGQLSKEKGKKLQEFLHLLEDLRALAATSTPSETIRSVLEATGYGAYAVQKRKKEKEKAKQQDSRKRKTRTDDSESEGEADGGGGYEGTVLKLLLERAEEFGKEWTREALQDDTEPRTLHATAQTALLEALDSEDPKKGVLPLADFIASIALQKDEEGAEADARDAVVLSTIHKAKGLEWPIVFVPRWNEGFTPLAFYEEKVPQLMFNKPSLTPQEHLEEERRLAHVAVTRAMDRLCISYIRVRARGKAEECEISTHPLPAEVLQRKRLPVSEKEKAALDRLAWKPPLPRVPFVTVRSLIDGTVEEYTYEECEAEFKDY